MPRVFRMNISPKLCTMYSILVIRNLLSFQEGYFICMLCFRPPPPSCSQLLWKECKSVFQWAPLKPSPLWDADRQAGGPLLTEESSGGRDLGLSAAVSREALSSHLYVPSLAVRDGVWEGKPVGTRGAVRDRFGDAVMGCSETYCGDTWRRRHDCRLYSFAFNWTSWNLSSKFLCVPSFNIY